MQPQHYSLCEAFDLLANGFQLPYGVLHSTAWSKYQLTMIVWVIEKLIHERDHSVDVSCVHPTEITDNNSFEKYLLWGERCVKS